MNGLFTWNKKRGNEHMVVVLLDRFFYLKRRISFQTWSLYKCDPLPWFESLAYRPGMVPGVEGLSCFNVRNSRLTIQIFFPTYQLGGKAQKISTE